MNKEGRKKDDGQSVVVDSACVPFLILSFWPSCLPYSALFFLPEAQSITRQATSAAADAATTIPQRLRSSGTRRKKSAASGQYTVAAYSASAPGSHQRKRRSVDVNFSPSPVSTRGRLPRPSTTRVESS